MTKFERQVFVFAAVGMVALPAAAHAINFGDDASPFAQDGECDDIRFVGLGMANKPTPKSRLLEAARRMMIDGNRYESDRAQQMYESGLSEQSQLDERAAELALAHVRHDATDCRLAYQAEKIKLRQ